MARAPILDDDAVVRRCAAASSGSTANAIAGDFCVCTETAAISLRRLANAGRLFTAPNLKHGGMRYFAARNVAEDYARTQAHAQLRRPAPTADQMQAARRRGPAHEPGAPIVTESTRHTVYARPEQIHDRIDKLAGHAPPDTPLPRVALRAGAFDYAGHPSRRGDRLVWRDGRVTDLQGRALEPTA